MAVTSLEFYIEGPKANLDFIADAASVVETDWRSEADKRIESLRKRNIKITLTTASGVTSNNVNIQV